MSEIKRSTLFGKLNPIAFKSVEAATIACKQRGNPYVELAHWIAQLLKTPNCDFQLGAAHFGCDFGRLEEDLGSILDRLPRGATAIADFSPHLDEAVERAWIYASLVFGEVQVRTGHVLLALTKTPSLKNVFGGISPEFERIKTDALTDTFSTIFGRSQESGLSPSLNGASPGDRSKEATPRKQGEEALRRFTTDLTNKARRGDLDPVIGRDNEIRQCLDVLMRRRQNNPILTGEAGVGKTAVVEGLAERIVAGDVPPALRDVRILGLDLGLLQAGASMKGEFEQRLRNVIDEVQSSAQPIILFIDEVHNLIGAGGAPGIGDAANLLKPALARGSLRTIAATTWHEYKKHIEKDSALTRRFQIVKVDEPDEERCLRMIRNVSGHFESHHRVLILDEALDAAVTLSHRYLTARQLPDKAIGLVDTACARVALSQSATPASVDLARRELQMFATEREILSREFAAGRDHRKRLLEIDRFSGETKVRLAALEARWKNESRLVAEILAVRCRLTSATVIEDQCDENQTRSIPRRAQRPEAVPTRVGSELACLQGELAQLQGEDPMVYPQVDRQAVASVVADWTGIPVGRMVKNEVERVLRLTDTLEQRVIGQRLALETISNRIRTSRAKLDNPSRPVGVFLLVGPSGTGKTETALSLAEALYGGEQKLITINMSEFQEGHTVSTLKGSPPGYVGYGEGGVLTEAVRRQPYSVILLDEVEKAHPDVHEIFFQVFDKGFMEDAEGRFIDFKNTVILLTSNTAQEIIFRLCKDAACPPSQDSLEKALRGPLMEVFPDALLNRLVVVPYHPISAKILQEIILLNLDRVKKRVRANQDVSFAYDASVPELIAQRCQELDRGARMVESLITQAILPKIGHEILSRIMKGKSLNYILVGAAEGEFTFKYE